MIYFDIETIPCQREDFWPDIKARVKPPATLKKAESIAAWDRDERPAAEAAAVDATGLDGAYGQVFCVAWAVDDGDVKSARVADLSPAAERDMLWQFFDEMREHGYGDTGSPRRVCGFNHVAFDLPFLFKRAVNLNVPPPLWWPKNPKPWSDRVFDCMTEYAGVGGKISLDRLARVLGYSGKGEMSGADVWPAVKDGEFDKVERYCRDDVALTRLVARRIQFKEGA